MGLVAKACATKRGSGVASAELECREVIVELSPSIESFASSYLRFISRTLSLCDPLLVFLHDLAHVGVCGNVGEIDGCGAIRRWCVGDFKYGKDSVRVFGAFSFEREVPAEDLCFAICVGEHVGELGIGGDGDDGGGGGRH
jgi:hypothetical protein